MGLSRTAIAVESRKIIQPPCIFSDPGDGEFPLELITGSRGQFDAANRRN